MKCNGITSFMEFVMCPDHEANMLRIRQEAWKLTLGVGGKMA